MHSNKRESFTSETTVRTARMPPSSLGRCCAAFFALQGHCSRPDICPMLSLLAAGYLRPVRQQASRLLPLIGVETRKEQATAKAIWTVDGLALLIRRLL